MKHYKSILFIILFLGIIILYVSSDLGIVEIEKNAIITAIAIDKEQDEYVITAQIALPEAISSSSKNEKTVIEAKGHTVSGAIKELGSTTGWYPKLSFCNLILIGKEMFAENVIKYLDYFANTLKIQYSTIVAGCDGTASDYLKLSTPLDNMTSFSIQKILLQGVGLKQNCVDVDIKTFSVGYYSQSKSSYFAYIKKVPIEESSQGGDDEFSSGSKGNNSSDSEGSDSESKDKKVVFDATTTVLFKDGMMVGYLTKEETQVFNYITRKLSKSALPVHDVVIDNESTNYLLTVLDNISKINLTFKNNIPTLNISADMYVRIDDQNGENTAINLTEKVYLPNEVKTRAEQDFVKNLTTLYEKCQNLGVDIFNVTNLLYRKNHSYYSQFKDTIIAKTVLKSNIVFHGQSR